MHSVFLKKTEFFDKLHKETAKRRRCGSPLFSLPDNAVSKLKIAVGLAQGMASVKRYIGQLLRELTDVFRICYNTSIPVPTL